ncbi:hypothetical protein HDK64DRAFT_258909 [Phyllosticta capitalensis]
MEEGIQPGSRLCFCSLGITLYETQDKALGNSRGGLLEEVLIGKHTYMAKDAANKRLNIAILSNSGVLASCCGARRLRFLVPHAKDSERAQKFTDVDRLDRHQSCGGPETSSGRSLALQAHCFTRLSDMPHEPAALEPLQTTPNISIKHQHHTQSLAILLARSLSLRAIHVNNEKSEVIADVASENSVATIPLRSPLLRRAERPLPGPNNEAKLKRSRQNAETQGLWAAHTREDQRRARHTTYDWGNPNAIAMLHPPASSTALTKRVLEGVHGIDRAPTGFGLLRFCEHHDESVPRVTKWTKLEVLGWISPSLLFSAYCLWAWCRSRPTIVGTPTGALKSSSSIHNQCADISREIFSAQTGSLLQSPSSKSGTCGNLKEKKKTRTRAASHLVSQQDGSTDTVNMKDSDMDRFVILEALLSTRSNCKYYNVPEGALTLRWHARMYDAAVGLRIPQLLQSSSFRTPRQARIFGYEKPSKDHWESVLTRVKDQVNQLQQIADKHHAIQANNGALREYASNL